MTSFLLQWLSLDCSRSPSRRTGRLFRRKRRKAKDEGRVLGRDAGGMSDDGKGLQKRHDRRRFPRLLQRRDRRLQRRQGGEWRRGGRLLEDDGVLPPENAVFQPETVVLHDAAVIHTIAEVIPQAARSILLEQRYSADTQREVLLRRLKLHIETWHRSGCAQKAAPQGSKPRQHAGACLHAGDLFQEARRTVRALAACGAARPRSGRALLS